MAEDPSGEQEDIDIVYKEADGYRTFFATIPNLKTTPQNAFFIDFMLEYVSDPQGEKKEVTQGRVGDVQNPGRVDLIREKQATAVLTEDAAMNTAMSLLSTLLGMSEQELLVGLDQQFDLSSRGIQIVPDEERE